MHRTSWPAKELSAFQEGLYSTDLVNMSIYSSTARLYQVLTQTNTSSIFTLYITKQKWILENSQLTYFSLKSNLYRILLSFHLANFISRLALFKGTNTYETSFSPNGPSTTCNASSYLPWKSKQMMNKKHWFFPGCFYCISKCQYK